MTKSVKALARHMIIKVKTFDELSAKEIYEILKARAEVFIVEQNIVYQDMDDADYDSLHVFVEEDGCVTAYMRAFSAGSDTVKIGRVLTLRRKKGLGATVLSKGIEEIKSRYHPKRIILDAQKYATGFYERAGFYAVGDEFLEEGIMHIKMVLDLGK